MPVQGESTVKGNDKIHGDSVVAFERINQVVRVFFGKIFDAKNFNTQGERCGSFSIAPEAWSTWGRFVFVLGDVADDLVEDDDSCLFEAIHATLYFKVYKTVGGDEDVVAWIIPHLLGNHLWEDTDVLLVLHGRVKVEIFDVDSEVAGTSVSIRDGAVYVELGIENAHDGRAGISRLV